MTGRGTSEGMGGPTLRVSRLPSTTRFTTGWTPLEVSVSKSSGTTGGFSCAIYQEDTTENKKICCRGDASRGQLGTLSTSSIKRPNTAIPVNWASGQGHVGSPAESASLAVGPHNVAEISIPVNGRFGCARSNLGHVKCWGYNNRGQLSLAKLLDRLGLAQ